MRKGKKKSLQLRQDTLEIISGFAERNAKIPNRVDSETDEKIPDEMPLWRWRMRKKKGKKLF